MEQREELINNVLKSFIADLNESGTLLSNDEGILFAGALIEYLRGVYNYAPSIPEYNIEGYEFDEDEFIDENLLKPFRHKMVPFIKTRLKLYFAKDDYNKMLLFQKLNINEPVLDEKEYEEYIIRVYLILRKLKDNLYLKPSAETKDNVAEAQKLLDNPLEMEKQGFKSKSTEYTRPRQVLLYYFVLKLMGMTKMDLSSRKYAKFAHVLFAWPIDSIDNSSVYKLLKKAPYLKKDDKAMLKDLEFVKEQFKLIESEEGVSLVQKEIDSVKR